MAGRSTAGAAPCSGCWALLWVPFLPVGGGSCFGCWALLSLLVFLLRVCYQSLWGTRLLAVGARAASSCAAPNAAHVKRARPACAQPLPRCAVQARSCTWAVPSARRSVRPCCARSECVHMCGGGGCVRVSVCVCTCGCGCGWVGLGGVWGGWPCEGCGGAVAPAVGGSGCLRTGPSVLESGSSVFRSVQT